MSVTLMRYKNGKPTPIKLSIWDAFKGVPVPKPRLHRCNCCNKLHKPGANVQATPETATTEEENEKPAEKVEESAKDPKTLDDQFTAEEDAKIIEMKTENKGWKEISTTLGTGKGPGLLKARWKQIEPKKEAADAEEKDREGGEPGKEPVKADKDKEQGLKRKKEKQGRKEAAEAEAAAAAEITEAAEPEAEAPAEELKVAETPSANYRQKWIAAASKHFDRTGQRITPEQARKLSQEPT